MVDIKKILASASPEAIQKLREIMNSKDDEALKSYLDTLIKDANKVESKVKEEPAKKKITAFFNQADYDWMRYKGKKPKRIAYNGMIVKLEPEDVFGIAKVVDVFGNYKCILPAYRQQVISLDPSLMGLVRAKCKPFIGCVNRVLKACKIRSPEKMIAKVKTPEIDSKIEAATYNEGRGEFRFDSIAGGFDLNCDPFYSLGFTGDKYVSKVSFQTFSSGCTDYSKEIDPKVLEEFNNAYKNGTSNKYYGQAIKELYKSLDKEILKAANDFDKTIESIMKKHGFKKI